MLRLIAIIMIGLLLSTDFCEAQENRSNSHKKSSLIKNHKHKAKRIKRHKQDKKNKFNDIQKNNQRFITQRSAIAIASQHYPGKVLRAVLSRQGHPVYRVKIVNSGRVKTISVDAYTGDIR